ncbi:hypothetical protein HMI54_002470 [Coelomomyces lativittatus]|nr:hypothetical protein HMI54_002470 [Coelomomyces lativittatus]KAJ1510903.1 hypothetical protein HMI56_006051 [Coelomomyces lativittatus]KAJ1517783.1 hypothetical protein HMI55_006024 [Coelomomyces lativittatus]
MLKRGLFNLPTRNVSKSVSFNMNTHLLHADHTPLKSSSVKETTFPAEEEHVQYTPSDFNTPFWKKTFFFTIGFTVLYHFNKNYENSLREKGQVHPITAYMSYYMSDQQESHDKVKDILLQDQVHAAKRLLLFEAKRKEVVHKPLPISLIQGGSPFCIPAGSQVDISKFIH